MNEVAPARAALALPAEQIEVLCRLKAAELNFTYPWESASMLDQPSADALVELGLAVSRTNPHAPSLGTMYRITAAGVLDYDARRSEGYGFTCFSCDETIEFLVVAGDHLTPEVLRWLAGWSLTPAEFPYDGNAHYYCPRCHERRPWDA